MAQELRLKINSDPANLAPVRLAIESLCLENSYPQEVVDKVGLCVNEAMANITRHAYKGDTDKPIEVVADCDSRRVRITLRDWGNGVDPSAMPPKAHNPLKPGGLGLICLREMLDVTEFHPQPDGMLLEMVKFKDKG